MDPSVRWDDDSLFVVEPSLLGWDDDSLFVVEPSLPGWDDDSLFVVEPSLPGCSITDAMQPSKLGST